MKGFPPTGTAPSTELRWWLRRRRRRKAVHARRLELARERRRQRQGVAECRRDLDRVERRLHEITVDVFGFGHPSQSLLGLWARLAKVKVV